MLKSIILLLTFIAVLGTIAFVWYRSGIGVPTPTETAITARETEERLKNFKRLKDIELDTDIVRDRLFRSFESLSLPPSGEPAIGRPNPFLPF